MAYDPDAPQTVRLDEGLDGHGLTFELVLIDGNEDAEWPTTTQIEDSSEQISLAYSFGFDPESAEPSDEGEHGQAYDFLKAHIGQVISDPGYYTGSNLRYKRCDRCGAHHRRGYGGDCNAPGERFIL